MKITFYRFYKNYYLTVKKVIRNSFDPFDPEFVNLVRNCFILKMIDAEDVHQYILDEFILNSNSTKVSTIGKYIKIAKVKTDRAELVLTKYIAEQNLDKDLIDNVDHNIITATSISASTPLSADELKNKPMFHLTNNVIMVYAENEMFYDFRAYDILEHLKVRLCLTPSDVSISSLNQYAVKISTALNSLKAEDGQQLDYSSDSLCESVSYKLKEPFFDSIEKVIFTFLMKKSEVDIVLSKLGKYI